MNLNKEDIKKIVKRTLKEDCPSEDITSSNIVFKNKEVKADIIARETAVLCGIEIVKEVFSQVSSKISFECFKEDGQTIEKRQVILSVYGPPSDILLAERTALNFLSHLTGISTSVHEYVSVVNSVDPSCGVLDTRKTIPGLRCLAKYAVRTGGGKNHRMNLSDQVLIKENHLMLSGKSIFELVSSIRNSIASNIKIELEIEKFSQLEEALASPLDIIMLDNFDYADAKKAVAYIRSSRPDIAIEVSGGINLTTISKVAQLGVDRISVGCITNSAPAVDFTLLIDHSWVS